MMISNKVLSGGTIFVDLRDGEFSFDVRKGKKSGRVSTLSPRREAALNK